MIRKKLLSSVNQLRPILLVLGVAAVTTLVLLVVKPHPTNRFQTTTAFVQEEVQVEESKHVADIVADKAEIQPQQVQLQPIEKKQRSVANWLAKRYRVADEAAHLFVSVAYLTAQEFNLDPLLILSVMAIESGLNPDAESPVGAQGLMQVMSKVHVDKFDELGGLHVALDPIANIRVGTQILKEYVTRGGSVQAGLKMYVGAALAEHDGGYGNKVLAEYNLLKDVANGKPVPSFITAKAVAIKPVVIKVKKNAEMNVDVSEEVSERQTQAGRTQET